MKIISILIASSLFSFYIFGQTDSIVIEKEIILPAPRKEGGMPLMNALSLRKSQRDFSDKKLSLQTLSDLLWAANGINRPESGKRTAPNAVNWQEIDIYVSLEQGIYLFDAVKHQLLPVNAGDYRRDMGVQRFTGKAAVNFVYVADYSKMIAISKDTKDFYSTADTGFISQNVYLFCASEGLATVVLGWIKRDKMSEILKLKKDQHIILSQSVGYPADIQEIPTMEE